MPDSQLPVVLTPSPKAYFRSYMVGILLSPLVIGLYIIWKAERKRRSTRYTITASMLTISDQKYSRNIDLVNISKIQVLHRFPSIGMLTLHTDTQHYVLVGLKDPDMISNIIRKAKQANT
ncbi:hypothetical protein [Gracilimonas amylolytica]|jgi:hypothetical protein|uniref:hypothetical protein n=1 Tax=Gracilimonas amylolytica TaxID=1749045 RepID=UPI000CD9984E|nr:hypothetical protein [Gracilimonas amylolytica]